MVVLALELLELENTQHTDGRGRKKRHLMSLESSQFEFGGSNSGSSGSGYRAEETAAFESFFDTAIFDDFDREMDERVEQLVGQWVHLAAPNAGRGRRMFAPIGTPSKKAPPKKNAS